MVFSIQRSKHHYNFRCELYFLRESQSTACLYGKSQNDLFQIHIFDFLPKDNIKADTWGKDQFE